MAFPLLYENYVSKIQKVCPIEYNYKSYDLDKRDILVFSDIYTDVT